MELYIQRDGQQIGPFTEGQVLAKVEDGSLSESDLAMVEGKTQWHPLSSFIVREPSEDSTLQDTAQPSTPIPTAAKTVSGEVGGPQARGAVSQPVISGTLQALLDAAKKKPIHAAVVLIAIVALLSLPAVLFTVWISHGHSHETASVIAEMNRRQVESQQQREVKQREAEQKQAEQLRVAKAEMEQRERETQSRQAAQLAQQKMERDKEEAENQERINQARVKEEQAQHAREMEITGAARQQEQNQQEEARKKQEEQTAFSRYAEDKLASLRLEPALILSAKVQALHLSFKFAGEKFVRLKELQAARDWKAWAMETEHYTGDFDFKRFSGIQNIDAIARQTETIDLALTMGAAPGADVTSIRVAALLSLENIPETDFPVSFQMTEQWKARIDQSGYFYRCKPSDCRLVLFVAPGKFVGHLLGVPFTVQVRDGSGNLRLIPVPPGSDKAPNEYARVYGSVVGPNSEWCAAGAEYVRIRDGFGKSLKGILEKKRMGEIPAQEAQKRCRELQQNTQNAVLSFATSY